MLNINQKGVSYWAIIIVLAVMVMALIVAFWPQAESTTDNISPAALWSSFRQKTKLISEKAKIEKWITDNGLNEFGDPADTLYAGGTPLFDESNGKWINRYDYIRQNHNDKPWNNK